MIENVVWFVLWAGSLALSLIANLIAPINILLGGKRGRAVVVSNDAALNAATGGKWRETISIRSAKARREGKWWGRMLCRIFDVVDPGHCEKQLIDEE